MQKEAKSLEARIQSIENRLNNAEKRITAYGGLEKELVALLRKQADAREHVVKDWINQASDP